MLGWQHSILPSFSVGQPDFPRHFEVSSSVATHPNGTRLHSTDVVNPKVPSKGSAVLLPGFCGTPVFEESVANIFADLGYRVRMPMPRGYGILPERSVRGEASLFGYGKEGMIAEDLPFLIDRANADFSEPVTLLGFSAGAFMAANYLSGAVADSSAGRAHLVRDEGEARERAKKVSRFIDFGGPHGDLPRFLPYKIMMKMMAPFLAAVPAYDWRGNDSVRRGRNYYLPLHLMMTPWPMRVMPMLVHPLAFSLSEYMNPANITYEEFVRLMFAGFGRVEHDHMEEQKCHLLGQRFPSEDGYDYLDSARSIRVPTFYVNGSCDRMSPPDQAERAMATLPEGVTRGNVVIPGRGHIDSTYGRSADRPLREALTAVLRD